MSLADGVLVDGFFEMGRTFLLCRKTSSTFWTALSSNLATLLIACNLVINILKPLNNVLFYFNNFSGTSVSGA